MSTLVDAIKSWAELVKAVSIKHGNGDFKGLGPLGEGVADKATERRESSCWQEGFLERIGLGARGSLSPP